MFITSIYIFTTLFKLLHDCLLKYYYVPKVNFSSDIF